MVDVPWSPLAAFALLRSSPSVLCNRNRTGTRDTPRESVMILGRIEGEPLRDLLCSQMTDDASGEVVSPGCRPRRRSWHALRPCRYKHTRLPFNIHQA